MRRLTLIRDKLRKHSPGTALPYREGKKAIEAMRLLARFRHDHFIAAHHDHIVWLQQMVTNQHPLELAPADTGIEKTRSEERRVGKECRTRWDAECEKKKDKV